MKANNKAKDESASDDKGKRAIVVLLPCDYLEAVSKRAEAAEDSKSFFIRQDALCGELASLSDAEVDIRWKGHLTSFSICLPKRYIADARKRADSSNSKAAAIIRHDILAGDFIRQATSTSSGKGNLDGKRPAREGSTPAASAR